MRLVISPQAVAVVRLPAGSPPPSWAFGDPLVSVTITSQETSVVCATSCLPDDLPGPVHGPLAAVHIEGTLEFSQVGVLVSLLRPLANGGIPVLTVSTFDTDWILLPSEKVAAAESLWRGAGYEIIDPMTENPRQAGHRADWIGTDPTGEPMVADLNDIDSDRPVTTGPRRPVSPTNPPRSQFTEKRR
jgi:hypothetical protein